MIPALKKLFLITFFAAGVWIYVMKVMGTVPIGTLFLYLGLWLAAGVVGLVLLGIRSPKRNGPTRGNPFDRMSRSEHEHAVAITQRMLSREGISSEDVAWNAALFEKYAPALTQSQQMEAFTAYLRSHAQEVRAGVTRQEGLHDGPAVVLARVARRPGFDVTADGTSWFGGLPALGDQAWPLDKGGQPMTPLAQIDLTGLASHLKVQGMPETGSLAFFAALPEKGEWLGRVVHVPYPGSPSQPPSPLPAVLNHSFGGPLRRGELGEDQRLYPRMALQLVPVSASGQADRKAFNAEVEAALGPGRKYNLSASLFKDVLDPVRPWNRDSVLRFLHGARIALQSGKEGLRTRRDYFLKEAKLVADKLETATEGQAALQAKQDRLKSLMTDVDQKLENLEPAIEQLLSGLADLETRALSDDRWKPLTTSEQEVLLAMLTDWTARNKPGRVLLENTYSVHSSIKDCVGETLLVMAAAKDDIFSSLPNEVQDAVNGPWRQPYDRGRHQMFGCPDSVQVAAEENDHALLLLQLQCDDIGGFHWGDAGVLQFWIRPEDLEAGRWDQAYMTFEGH